MEDLTSLARECEINMITKIESDPKLLHWLVNYTCLLYTSDAAGEEGSVDLGGRRIIKKTHPRFGGFCVY